MKFFVDTADTDAIRELNELGMVDGVTTNPSLIHKSGRDIKEVIAEIAAMVPGPVSAETVATDAEGMIAEGLELKKIGENIAIKAAGPLLLFRVKVLELDQISDRAALFEELLTLNTSDLVHGAYGISEDAIVLTCTLQVENLDYNELQGVLDDFSLALANHYEKLSKFRVAT